MTLYLAFVKERVVPIFAYTIYEARDKLFAKMYKQELSSKWITTMSNIKLIEMAEVRNGGELDLTIDDYYRYSDETFAKSSAKLKGQDDFE
jgi:L-rhamnose mutarotase